MLDNKKTLIRRLAAGGRLGAYVGLVACTSAAPDAGRADAGLPDAPATDAAADVAAGDAAVAIPDSAAGAQLSWLLALLNGPSTAITAAEVAPHFSAGFRAQVPIAQLVTTLAAAAAAWAPVTLRLIESSSPGASDAPATVVAIVETANHLFYRITLAASLGLASQIIGLSFVAAPERDPGLADPAALDARLSSVAPESRLLVARADDGCSAIHALGADQTMPLGSLFKVYVLGLLAVDVAAGRANWTDAVTIQDEWKSLPSGVLQNLPNGSTVSIQEAASDMISISDNTGADTLLRLLGRERVEANQAAMGHSNPALNVPFLTTREMFELKLSASTDERAAYLAADPDLRRSLLDNDYDLRPLPSLVVAAAWTTPIEIERIEWFATPADICRAFAALKGLGAQPAGSPVMSILSINPGLPLDPSVFSYVGYKGGSEPGVLTLSWLLQRVVDGTWVSVTLGFADSALPIDETLAVYYGMAAVQMAGR